MPTTTLVTTCCKEKRTGAAPLPAVERYRSARIQQVYARSLSERRPMLILSGLLGLIRPETPIYWYDRRLLPEAVDGMVDLITHHLLWYRVEAVELVIPSFSSDPGGRPYHDLLAAACRRKGIEMSVKEYLEG